LEPRQSPEFEIHKHGARKADGEVPEHLKKWLPLLHGILLPTMIAQVSIFRNQNILGGRGLATFPAKRYAGCSTLSCGSGWGADSQGGPQRSFLCN
jgi:hypothetical protein